MMFCIIVDTPMVAINGNNSLLLRLSGAKINELIVHPSTAPTANAATMLTR